MLHASLPLTPSSCRGARPPMSYAVAASGARASLDTVATAFQKMRAQPDAPAQSETAYRLLKDMCTTPRGPVLDPSAAKADAVERLQALLPQVLALPEDAAAPMFTAWFTLVRENLGDAALATALAWIDMAGGPRDANALAELTARIALQEMLHTPPHGVREHLGPLLDWLLAQPPHAASDALGGMGGGMSQSSCLEPEHVLELFRLLSHRQPQIEAAGAWQGISQLVNDLGGDEDFLRPHAETLFDALRSQRRPAQAGTTGILGVLLRATLRPQMDAAALEKRLPPAADLLRLPGLGPGDAQQLGQDMAALLGGAVMNASAMSWLVRGCLHESCDANMATAFARGVVQGAGGAAAGAAQVDAIARALADHMDHPLAPALALEAAAVLAVTAGPADSGAHRSFAAAACACAWLAPRHLDLAITAALGVLQRPGAPLDPSRFDELMAPLLSQAVRAAGSAPMQAVRTWALAALFECHAWTLPAPPSRRMKARGSSLATGGPNLAERSARAARFLQAQADELSRGPGRVVLEPLVQALGYLIPRPAPVANARL